MYLTDSVKKTLFLLLLLSLLDQNFYYANHKFEHMVTCLIM